MAINLCVCLLYTRMSGLPVWQAPLYLADDCCLVSDSTRRSLRSADVPTCVVPRTLSSYGDRNCPWNSLSVQLRNPDITIRTVQTTLLKGHLFGKHEHGALWLLICGALEKHLLTYLLSYLITKWMFIVHSQSGIKWSKNKRHKHTRFFTQVRNTVV